MIKLRRILEKDLLSYRRLNHPSRLFHEYNGPYFERESLDDLDKRICQMRLDFKSGKDVKKQAMMIVDSCDDDLIGEVSYYWKSKETNWMEIGVVIFNEAYWGQAIGYHALCLWINQVFEDFPSLVRLGLTTWSGNERMMKLAEKLGMIQEACYRQARIYQGKYYDSVSYGILKEEWRDKHDNDN